MTASTLRTVNIQQLLKIVLGVVLSVGAVVGLISVGAAAQSSEDAAAANTLKVSPVRSDVSADPGETKVVKVTVTNPSNQRVSVRTIQNDFVAGDEDGTPAIYLDETEFAPSHSLKRFMVPVDSIILEGNESKVIDVELNVPADAEPGGYYGVVRFAPSDPDTGGQVNVSASVASLVLLRVSGEASEKLTLTNFDVRQGGSNKAFFVNGDNITLNVRFKNEGAVHAGPFGKVSVLKGDNIVHDSNFNDKEQRDMVLPNSARSWSIPLDGISGFGRYTVSATFTYGANNQTIEMTETFWVVPNGIIITAIVALLALVGAAVAFVMRRRRNSRSIGLSGGSSKR